MSKHLLDLSFVGVGKAKSVPGQEKFTFLYGAVSAVAITCAIAYSMFASLAWLQSLLLLIGCLFVGCALVFTFIEVHRAAGASKKTGEVLNEDADLYASRTVDIRPPTGEPYPHHEDFAESAGLDQGQLTSRIPGSTPFLDVFSSRRSRKQKAAR